MKIIVNHNITQTPWAIDSVMENSSTIKKSFFVSDLMKKELWWIKSYEEYIRIYLTNWHYKKWTKFLKELESKLIEKNYINKDPIEYLIYLYSKNWEGLPINEIFNRTYYLFKEIIHNDTFRKFFSNILKWDLRDATERTDFSKRKAITSKNTISIKNENNLRQKKAQELFIKQINEILKQKNIKKDNKLFSKIHYDSIKFKKEKNIYLISILLSTEKTNVILKIKELNEISWYKVIARWLNNISKEKWINIELTNNDIRHLIN
jgi:hypothetical protein